MLEGREIVCPGGGVVATPLAAARIGAEIMKIGGNAMDAAAATSLACSMLAPQSNGVGGYMAVALVLEAATGRVWSLDANSVSPSSAHVDMYTVLPSRNGLAGINENEYGCSVADDANVVGPKAVGVPGQLAGVGLLWERWGRLRWEEIVAPSQRLLSDGFHYGESLAKAICDHEGQLRRFPATASHLMPQGCLPRPDDHWHRPDMEKTLSRLASAGWQDFYVGKLGRTLADYVHGHGGLLTREDMAAYAPRLTEPYSVSYRQAKVDSAILPNGGLSTLQTLQVLECFDLETDDSARYWHVLAEVLKLTWRDRLRYLGDPDFVEVPIERLLSKDYAAGRAAVLRDFPDRVDRGSWGLTGASIPETLHVSAVDVQGNLVAITITQGGAFGSCVTVPDTGVILGHGMCRFDPRPGGANSVAAGKRPLNNTAPMILRLPERVVALGMPGGRRIISVAPRLAQQIVDGSAGLRRLAVSPRLHLVGEEPLEVQDDFPVAVSDRLISMGHELVRTPRIGGDANCAEFSYTTPQSACVGGNGWAVGLGN